MAITESRAVDVVLFSAVGAALGIFAEMFLILGLTASATEAIQFTGWGAAVGGAAGFVYGLIRSSHVSKIK